ncbi:hypothetical protein [Bacillus sp. NPDC094106]|uniref:hypothetical protein n=1 Tax=Bacillus sp. NPDC094106 TaxID=3363949 RepID=UPI003828970F
MERDVVDEMKGITQIELFNEEAELVSKTEVSAMKELLANTRAWFPKSFINDRNELIFEPTNNIYFRLENIQDELDFKCKLLAWLSRPSCKGTTAYWQRKILRGVNGLLGTHFSKDEMRVIYIYLGNDTNRELTIQFIQSNYDLSLLKDEQGGVKC